MATDPFADVKSLSGSTSPDPFANVKSPSGSTHKDPFGDVTEAHLKAPQQAPPHSSPISHHAQLVARGALDGTVGLLDLPSTAYTLATGRPGYASIAGRAGDALGLDRPRGMGEQLEEAAASGVIPGLGAVRGLGLAAKGASAIRAARTAKVLQGAQMTAGAALGSGTLGGAIRGGAGAVTGTLGADAAEEAGLGPRAQIAAGLITGSAPTFGITAARAGAKQATDARARAVDARAQALVPPDRAPVTASVVEGIDAYHKKALNSGAWANSAASYIKDGAGTLTGLADALHKKSAITTNQRETILRAVGQASAHQNSLSTAPGSAYNAISQMANIPPDVRNTLLSGLDHLDTASSNKLLKNSKGPLEKFGSRAGALTPFLGHHTFMGLLESPIGMSVGGTIGRGLDGRFGLAKAPAQRLSSAAQRVLDITDQRVADNPLETARDLTASYLTPPPLTTDEKFASVDAAQAEDMKAIQARAKAAREKERTLKQAFKRAEQDGIKQGERTFAPKDLLTNSRYWPTKFDPYAAKRAAQQEAKRVTQLTQSQVSGFNADTRTLAKRDAADLKAEDRGTSLNEAAGAWLERQQIKRFNQDNPDISLPGAAALRPGGDVFSASGGRVGSPAAPSGVNFGVPSESLNAPSRPAPRQATPTSQAPEVSPQETPPEFQPELRGGQVLINHKLTDQRLPPALHNEIVDAVNEGALAGLPPQMADAVLGGQNIDGYTAGYLARMAHHLRSGASHPGDYDGEAAEAVRNAFASVSAPPNGPSNMGRPIDNYHRWAGAAQSYQSAVDGASRAASAAGHHEIAARMQDLKVMPKTEAKQALYQELLAKHPEAASFISDQLLKGID